MPTIAINQETCIHCLKCLRICPSVLFQLNDDKKVTVDAKDCISCGQCVAICPTASIAHSDFPVSHIHEFDRNHLPTPAQVELLINSRRSNRAFSPKPIPQEDLLRIIEAGHRAPTATNAQGVKMVLVTNEKIMKEISRITINIFNSAADKLENPLLKPLLKRIMPQNYGYVPVFRRLRDEFNQGNDGILRGAKAAIFIYTDKKSRFGCQDSNLAYQNASLMAESMGIAQFYTGFICSAAGMDHSNKIQKLLGIEGTLHAGMALGIPLFHFEKYIDRKELDLKIIS